MTKVSSLCSLEYVEGFDAAISAVFRILSNYRSEFPVGSPQWHAIKLAQVEIRDMERPHVQG